MTTDDAHLLVNTANSSSAVPGTGEISPARKAQLQRFWLQAEARKLLPKHRVVDCLRKQIPGKPYVEIWRAKNAQAAHYRNLMTCNSVWACPVCASKITEKRREDLRYVIDHVAHKPMLVTLTMRHSANDSLHQSITDLMGAYARMCAGRAWHSFRELYDVVGWVRALEITIGKNGWHPHLHILMWCDDDLRHLEDFTDDLQNRWMAVLRLVGRTVRKDIGCDVRHTNDAIADYVAKFGHDPKDPKETKARYWGMDSEMTKAIVKRSEGKHQSMTSLLEDSARGDVGAGRRWAVYANEMFGRRQMEWSRAPNMRDLAGLPCEEPSGAEIMATHDAEAYLFAQLNCEQWRHILDTNLQSVLIDIASIGDEQRFWEIVEGARRAIVNGILKQPK